MRTSSSYSVLTSAFSDSSLPPSTPKLASQVPATWQPEDQLKWESVKIPGKLATEYSLVRVNNRSKLKANGMSIVAPSAQLKADMKKVGDVMLKEWLEKAGPEGKALVDAYLKP